MATMETATPEGWRRVKIKDIATIQTGFAFKSDWYVESGIPLLRNANVSQRCIDWTDRVCLPEDRFNEFEAFKMEQNDIVLSLDRPLVAAGLKVAMLTPDDIPSLLVQRVARFKLSEEIDASFLYAFLQSPLFINQISGHDQSLGVPHISPTQVSNVKCLIPPMTEQKRIGMTIAEKIRVQENIFKAATNQHQNVCRLYQSKLRELLSSRTSVSWREFPLGSVCQIVMGQSPPGSSYNFEGWGEPLLNGPSEFGETGPHAVQWTTEPRRFSQPGDILFCVRGATAGRKVFSDRRYCIGRGLAALRGIPEMTDTEFLFYLLDEVTAGLLKKASGSTFHNLPADEIKGFAVTLPPIEEQKRIARLLRQTVSGIESVTRAGNKQLDAINALPAAILRQAFSGQL